MAQAIDESQGVAPGGVDVACADPAGAARVASHLQALFADSPLGASLRLAQERRDDGGWRLIARVDAATQAALAPGHDTLGLGARLSLPAPAEGLALEQETVAAMLLAPALQPFPSPEEFESALRIRGNVVLAARRTALSFDTRAVERPVDSWNYREDTGFTVRPGVPLIDALRKATQPGVSGQLYAFSCYRATEYVLLLGLAEELAVVNPPLLAALERVWQRRAIASGRFHDAFLRETGSIDDPLPQRWYVPGDRVWFRNPDEASADASGYEGSWVVYLGGGLFANFWKRDQPYAFDAKCVEVYHWRHATFRDAEGELRMDEDVVAEHVARTLRDPAETARILERMQRYRDRRGVYADGGCIDSTREQLRWVRPGTSDIELPDEG
jgi:hypothetical protein